MIRLTRSQVQPIGLDLGQDSVRMLQVEASDKSLSVVAAARQTLPEEARNQPELRLPVAIEMVRQMLKSAPFSGKEVVACLPREIVHVKNIRLPMMPPSELASAVEFEARNIFSFDPEKAMVRYLPAGEVRQGTDSRLEVIALAAMKQEVDAFVEQLHRSGCTIVSLDFEASAIYRGVERFIRRREDENEVHALVDIGLRQTRVIIGKGREISFYKVIEIGSLHLHEDVSRKLGITHEEARALRSRLSESSDASAAEKPEAVRQAVHDAIRTRAEELAREIGLCLRYYSVTFRGHRPAKVRLLGSDAGDPQLISILNAAMPIPVVTGEPLLSVDVARMKQSERRRHSSEWATAFGLGLKQTRGYFGAKDGKKREAVPAPAQANDVESAEAGKQVQEVSNA